MSLEKEDVLDVIEVTETGHLQVREAAYIKEDGIRVSGPSYHRYVLAPGDDLTGQPQRVLDVAGAVWTPEVIAAEEAAAAERRALYGSS